MKAALIAAIVSAVVLASIGVVSARSLEQRPTPHRLLEERAA
jgi:hypothetical protein